MFLSVQWPPAISKHSVCFLLERAYKTLYCNPDHRSTSLATFRSTIAMNKEYIEKEDEIYVPGYANRRLSIPFNVHFIITQSI